MVRAGAAARPNVHWQRVKARSVIGCPGTYRLRLNCGHANSHGAVKDGAGIGMNTTRKWAVSGGGISVVAAGLYGLLWLQVHQDGMRKVALILLGLILAAAIILGGCVAIGAFVIASIRRENQGFRAGVAQTIDRLVQALRPRDEV